MIITKGDDIGLVRLRYASPNDLIGTILKQVWIVPEKILHHGHEFGLILPPPMQRHLTGDKIVYYVSKPWWEHEKYASTVHRGRSQSRGWLLP
jgi:hypothetical protein